MPFRELKRGDAKRRGSPNVAASTRDCGLRDEQFVRSHRFTSQFPVARNALERLRSRLVCEAVGNFAVKLPTPTPREIGVNCLLEQRVTESYPLWLRSGIDHQKSSVDERLQTASGELRAQLK